MESRTVTGIRMLVSSLLFVLSLSSIAFAEYAYIPDNNLKKALNAYLGKGDVLTDITVAELNGLTGNPHFGSKSISNLTGIEHCIHINSLNLGGNTISDLGPLSGLTNLRSLHLSNNPFKDSSPRHSKP